MEKINLIWEIDKKTVFDFLYKNCLGSWNSKHKDEILPEIKFVNEATYNYITKERYFRRIIAELKKEGHVYSCSVKGYWFGVLFTTNIEEIRMMLYASKEDVKKSVSTLRNKIERVKRLETTYGDLIQNQDSFFNENSVNLLETANGI